MKQENNHLEQIKEIHRMMESSSKFISLSGLSGVFAGIFALIAAAFSYYMMQHHFNISYMEYAESIPARLKPDFMLFCLVVASSVLLLSIGCSILLSIRKAKRKGLRIFDRVAFKMLINLFIPLIAGGLFCLILVYYGLLGLLAPCTLIFYGLALINAGKYSLSEIKYLGLSELALGLLGCLFLGYGLLLWAIGFGLLHIMYGALMYYKYDRLALN